MTPVSENLLKIAEANSGCNVYRVINKSLSRIVTFGKGAVVIAPSKCLSFDAHQISMFSLTPGTSNLLQKNAVRCIPAAK